MVEEAWAEEAWAEEAWAEEAWAEEQEGYTQTRSTAQLHVESR